LADRVAAGNEAPAASLRFRPAHRPAPLPSLLGRFRALSSADRLGHPPARRAEPFWTDCAIPAEAGISSVLLGARCAVTLFGARGAATIREFRT
jgi:hypothetical protein